jgi:alpha-tubulin suppressor-like RCC1 family protein
MSIPAPAAQIEVYAWGRGDCGQLGTGEAPETATYLPQIVEPLRSKNIVCLAAGSFHSAGITSDGEIYTWGANDEGQCARKGPEAEQVVTPTRVEVLENFKIDVAACGANHTIAVSEDGGVFGFGEADFGQLGVGDVSVSKIVQPKACKALKEAGRVVRAAAGGNHSLFLESSGMVYVTGDASFGALGLSSSTSKNNSSENEVKSIETGSIFTPLELFRLWPVGICQLSAGDAHSAALTVDGSVYTWGRGKSGALGIGNFQNTAEPTLIRALTGMAVKQITCGADHTVALTQEGRVYACGAGKYGATGLGHDDSVCTPQKMAGLEGRENREGGAAVVVVQVSAGGRHTLLLTESNEVWATGSNENGQCGISKLENSKKIEEEEEKEESQVVLVPRPLAGLPSSSLILFIASGGDHSFAVVQPCHSSSATGTSSFSGVESEELMATERTKRARMLLPGPRPERPHGDCWLPSTPAPLLPLVRAAISTNTPGPETIKALKTCVHATFSNPSYLTNAFTLAAATTATATEAAQPSEQQQRIGVPRLDISAITEAYQGFLKLYDQGIVTVLGSASIKLLESKLLFFSSRYFLSPN